MLTGTGIAAGLAAINSFGNLGGFVGPYLLGLLAAWLGSRTAGVAVLGAFMVCAGILIVLCCRHYGLRDRPVTRSHDS
jgi:nitrate/nitrite transporter NarK